MSKQRLDPSLLEKLHLKTGKDKQRLRDLICKKAGRLGISTAAAQIVLAKEARIGIAATLNRLPAEIREEVRGAQNSGPARLRIPAAIPQAVPRQLRKSEAITAATIVALLQDAELRGRCKDLLRARGHFDRVIREATTVLDDRLKKRTGIQNVKPQDLVARAISADPARAILEVSADPAEQEGFFSICKGIMLAFRNKAHHSLSEKFTREDALKFCGFVDTVLGVIEQSTIHPERV